MSFDAVPNELIREVFSHCQTSDLLALCLASRRLHSQSILSLYHTADFEDAARIVKWCEALKMRPELTEMTINLSMELTPTAAFDAPLLEMTLSMLCNLHTLEIWSSSLFIFSLLKDAYFPRLVRLAGLVTADIFLFLERHRHTLECVQIHPGRPDAQAFVHAGFPITLPATTLVFPNLKRLSMSAAGAAAMVPGSVVTSVQIYWPFNPVAACNYDKLAAAIAGSRERVRQVDNLLLGWPASAGYSPVASIAEHLGDQVKRLGFTIFGESHSDPLEVLFTKVHPLLASIENHLPKFQQLNNIFSPRGNTDRLAALDEDTILDALSRDYEVIEKWRELCPTLVTVCLPATSVPWAKVDLGVCVWLPDTLPTLIETRCATPWTMVLFKWFLKLVIQAVSRNVELARLKLGVALAIDVVGGEGWQVLSRKFEVDGRIPDFELLLDPDGDSGERDFMKTRIRLLD
ncbi:hypothetical protein MKEN_00541700 [Mycena kentingensis (nom. inval.)]|nr:hypothetical protein MKEN_00541700 [Mycena kentingensis (nom. inval.)]